MAGEKLHSCTLTVNPMHGPIPCEACAEMPRCPHGMRADVDRCDSCALVDARAQLESALTWPPEKHATFIRCAMEILDDKASARVGAENRAAG
jgi:hypothetical protein